MALRFWLLISPFLSPLFLLIESLCSQILEADWALRLEPPGAVPTPPRDLAVADVSRLGVLCCFFICNGSPLFGAPPTAMLLL